MERDIPVLVVPIGLIRELSGPATPSDFTQANAIADRMEIAARAREIVMERERQLGYEPRDVEFERLGYDIESIDRVTGALRFIEVKGRTETATTITVTKNEILYSLNNPEHYVLAIISFGEDGSHINTYLKSPFHAAPDFGAQSVNYSLEELIASGVQDFG